MEVSSVIREICEHAEQQPARRRGITGPTPATSRDFQRGASDDDDLQKLQYLAVGWNFRN